MTKKKHENTLTLLGSSAEEGASDAWFWQDILHERISDEEARERLFGKPPKGWLAFRDRRRKRGKTSTRDAPGSDAVRDVTYFGRIEERPDADNYGEILDVGRWYTNEDGFTARERWDGEKWVDWPQPGEASGDEGDSPFVPLTEAEARMKIESGVGKRESRR